MTDLKPIKERIRSFIVLQFPVAKARALDEMLSLLSSGIVDSLGILDVVAFLEQDFHITISDEELVPENFDSITRLAMFVERKTSVAKVAAQ